MSANRSNPNGRRKRLPGIPWKLRLINAVAGGWRAIGLPSRSRSADDWVNELRGEWRQLEMATPLPAEKELRRFLECILNRGELSSTGIQSLWSMVRETVLRTAAFEHAISSGGAAAQRVLDDPLIVLGLPRTGTTLLQRLLLQHPGCRWLRSWEISVPFPEPDHAWGGPDDPRREAFEAELQIKRRNFSDLNDLHPLESPQECWPLVMSGFVALTPFLFFGLGGLEEFESALDEESVAEAYASFRRQLQYLNAREPGSHWVLKAPEHSFHPDQLAQAFPRGRYVQLHRPAPTTVVSMCTLAIHAQRYFTRRLEPRRLGSQVLNVVCLMLERMLRAGEHSGLTIHDIAFSDLIGSPLKTVEGVHDQFGIPLEPEVRNRLEIFISEQMRGERSGYRYDLESFGLSEQVVRQAIGACYERAGVDRAFAE